MTKKIEKLTLHNFRGASGKCEIPFDLTKSVVMIFGENGTGKSTIADAIDFIANSTLGSIEDRSCGSAKQIYLPTIFKKSFELKVELTGQDGCWTAKLSGKLPLITGGPGKIRARVLRRANLLKLIEAQPAKRYEELQGFIDVAKNEASEQSLRDAFRAVQIDHQRAIDGLNDASSALRLLWTQEGSSGINAEAWAKQKSETDQSNLRNRIECLKAITKSLEIMATKCGEFNAAIKAIEKSDGDLQGIKNEIALLPQVSGAQAVELVQLLEQAKTIVAQPDYPNVCPVCEKPITATELSQSISNRLAGMESHQTLAQRRSQTEKNLHTAKTTHNTAVSVYIKSVRTAASQIKSYKQGSALAGSISWPIHEAFIQSIDIGEDQVSAAQIVKDQLSLIEPAYKTDLESAQADLNQYNAIKGHYDRIVNNRNQANKLETLQTCLDKALKICEETRKNFTQNVLQDVVKEMNRLYSIIHPNEPLGDLRLLMDSSKRGSIEQDATFAGQQQVPPQAYFSESHLDTLGFCVWLALAKRDHPKETVIVLDDVFTSVDSVHLTRIMELLSDIAKDFAQVIITTHYRSWRDRYRLPLGPGLTVQLMELHRWTLARGVSLSGTKLALQDLEAALKTEPLDRQAVASQSGILLETILDRLTFQYRLNVPRQRDELTLGDLLSSCKKLFDVLAIEKTLPVSSGDPPPEQPTIKASIQPFVQGTGLWNFIRNKVGCHFSFNGSEVADTDIEKFGKDTVSLVKALTCLKCGDIPNREDGTHFRCVCKQTKLTPLEFNK